MTKGLRFEARSLLRVRVIGQCGLSRIASCCHDSNVHEWPDRSSECTQRKLPAMGEIYSDFLDELLSNIRARPISWEAQQRSGVIDDGEVKTVKMIDKLRQDKRSEVVRKVASAVTKRTDGQETNDL